MMAEIKEFPEPDWANRPIVKEMEVMVNSRAFGLFWKQYQAQVSRARTIINSTSHKGKGSDEYAMDMAFNRGFMYGLDELQRVIPEILEQLQKGPLPVEGQE
jgi:hypothetical protein